MLGLRKFHGIQLDAWQGDITRFACDGVVSAANASLEGSDVDGAIHRAAGPELAVACRGIGRREPGDAVSTPGFLIPARRIIHATVPLWSVEASENCGQVLALCYRRCLEIAADEGLAHLAFPAIGTGATGFPVDQATRIGVTAVRDFLSGGLQRIQRVTFVGFSEEVYRHWQSWLLTLVAGEDDP